MNTILNSSRFNDSIDLIIGMNRGAVIYVIFAGPSVEDNLRVLKQRGVPRGTITIGINRGAVHWEAVMGEPVDYFLLADGSITEEMCRRLWGGLPHYRNGVFCNWVDPGMVTEALTYWFRCSGLGHEQVYTGTPLSLPALEYSYNTGTMSLHLADFLGASEIHLIGADFALPGGKFHTDEVAYFKDHRNAMCCEDIEGKLIMCREDQFCAARKMETWAYILSTYGVKVVNRTGAGQLKRFMEQVPFK
ncbi:MAG: hypothetical protein QME66_08345 [Candidatus Eisenbacteria bacterium]|nr:hypothetical protein [Candidatus Eisenbacteria bacterium]